MQVGSLVPTRQGSQWCFSAHLSHMAKEQHCAITHPQTPWAEEMVLDQGMRAENRSSLFRSRNEDTGGAAAEGRMPTCMFRYNWSLSPKKQEENEHHLSWPSLGPHCHPTPAPFSRRESQQRLLTYICWFSHLFNWVHTLCTGVLRRLISCCLWSIV